jgi:hypothetical protein
MNIYKFRAWVKHTIDNKFNYAWDEACEKFDPSEPSLYDEDDWYIWEAKKSIYYEELRIEWDNTHTEDEEYTYENKMITDIKVNGIVQRPYSYEILDVMLSSGLIDMFNKEIFDGDLAYDSDNNEMGVVSYEEGAFYVTFGNIIILLNEVNIDIEIIGNKWDNPELLEEENK